MYQGLASIYDRLSSIDHAVWADFLEQVFVENGLTGKTVLDLACGTGNMCKELARRGYKPVGLDLSEEMLAMADHKLQGLGVPLYQADMRKLPPLGSFDAIICLSDSFNYLADSEELRQVLQGLAGMGPQLLVFDLNTPYYLGQVLGDNSFHHVEEELAYIWENSFDPDNALCEMQLTFFAKEEPGTYRRFEECHLEKAFELEEVKQVLLESGWKLLKVHDGYSRLEPGDSTERWLFVAVPG